MKNILKYLYLVIIIFIAGAGVAKAVGTLNYDQVKDAFVIDGKLTFNNPSAVNIFLKQLVSNVTSPFYINADKDLQFRLGQNSADTSFTFTIHNGAGKPTLSLANNGNLSLSSDLSVANGVKFGVNATNGSLNVSGATKATGGISEDGSASLFLGWKSTIKLNGANGMITFPRQSLGFGMTTGGFRWANLSSSSYAMELSTAGALAVVDRVSAATFCLAGLCPSTWAAAIPTSTYLTKVAATNLINDQVDPSESTDAVKDIDFGFGGIFSTTNNSRTSCQKLNFYGPAGTNGGCSCPTGYTESLKITNTAPTNDIYFCYKL